MQVVAAFPGCGKSTFFRLLKEQNVNRPPSDSDSSQFDKSQFPQNYLDHIAERCMRYQSTFTSTHDVVRQGLVDRRIPFILAYPDRALCKEEYVKRYIDRAGTGGLMNEDETPFARLMEKNWDAWIQECEAQKSCVHVVLKPGQFLSDVIDFQFGEFQLKQGVDYWLR